MDMKREENVRISRARYREMNRLGFKSRRFTSVDVMEERGELVLGNHLVTCRTRTSLESEGWQKVRYQRLDWCEACAAKSRKGHYVATV